jgi:hypothetical protein
LDELIQLHDSSGNGEPRTKRKRNGPQQKMRTRASANRRGDDAPKHEISGVEQNADRHECHGAPKAVDVVSCAPDSDCGWNDGGWDARKNATACAAESLDRNRGEDCHKPCESGGERECEESRGITK